MTNQRPSAGVTTKELGEDLLRQLSETITAIQSHPFPRLIVEQVTDDGEAYLGLRCPVCLTDINGSEELTMVTLVTQTRTADALGDEEIERGEYPEFEDNDDPIHQFLHYKCCSCGAAVRLPHAWRNAAGSRHE